MDACRQLTIYDAIDHVAREARRQPFHVRHPIKIAGDVDEPFGWSRIGEGLELGMTLLQPLLMRGWTLHETPAFAGGGRRLFILARAGGLEVKAEGETLGDVATALFEQAAPFTPWPAIAE